MDNMFRAYRLEDNVEPCPICGCHKFISPGLKTYQSKRETGESFETYALNRLRFCTSCGTAFMVKSDINTIVSHLTIVDVVDKLKAAAEDASNEIKKF